MKASSSTAAIFRKKKPFCRFRCGDRIARRTARLIACTDRLRNSGGTPSFSCASNHSSTCLASSGVQVPAR
ncbi:hypothetical protein [Mucilaginibacter gracilis]|uniref:hypothetical protein n=1 Tax=Mucilaginibacter gracilis TaxID=423350 RepID=UPI001FEAF692|nr:hypothetical protein [Mucilaginibacter gracilis]